VDLSLSVEIAGGRPAVHSPATGRTTVEFLVAGGMNALTVPAAEPAGSSATERLPKVIEWGWSRDMAGALKQIRALVGPAFRAGCYCWS
jgi:hypothetical protein